MYCTKRITDDMSWVGADDRRLAFFEGVYGVPDGVSYNSYIIKDEKTILFDTVDKAVCHNFFETLNTSSPGAGWTISSSPTWSPTMPPLSPTSPSAIPRLPSSATPR